MFRKLTLIIVATSFTVASCNNSKKDNDNIPGMSQFNLSSFGAPIIVNVPDTTKTKLDLVAQGSGSIEIRSGKDFQIVIAPGEADFQLKKSDIASDDVKKFKRYVVDEPTNLIWESQVSGLEPEFHFFTVVKIGKDNYLIEDVKDGDSFSEIAIQKMAESAKGIKAVEAAN